MIKQIFKPVYYAIAMFILLISCKKQEQAEVQVEPVTLSGRSASEISNVFKGANVAFGDGHMRSWIRIDHLNKPLEIGIEITESAMNGLPDEGTNVVLPLHHKALEVTPFRHIYTGYNPNGHPPAGVFNVPHFDAHFYYTTNQERLAIPEVSPATLPFFTYAPPLGYMAPSYFQAGPEPQMGQHWIPPPPSFLPFTRLMVYGSYNGATTFLEPMVTIAHMLSGNSSNAFLQPAKFAQAGNYPTVFNVYRDAQSGNYNITLSNFMPRPAN